LRRVSEDGGCIAVWSREEIFSSLTNVRLCSHDDGNGVFQIGRLVEGEGKNEPAVVDLFDDGRGGVHIDAATGRGDTGYSKVRIGVRSSFADQAADQRIAGRIGAGGGKVVLLVELDGLSKDKLRAVVGARAENDCIAGEVVSVEGAEARVVPGVYAREQAVREFEEFAGRAELADGWEWVFGRWASAIGGLIHAEGPFLLKNLDGVAVAVGIPLADFVKNRRAACTTGVAESR
jgi:hypothetical protein